MREIPQKGKNGEQSKKIKVFLSGSMLYGGGGQEILISLCNTLSSKGHKVFLFDNAFSSVEKRWSKEYVSSKMKFQYNTIEFSQIGIFQKIFRLANPSPPLQVLEKNCTNLIMVHRLPSNRLIRKIDALGLKAVFLLHGVAFETLRIQKPLILLYQTYLRIVLQLNHRYYSLDSIRFQVLNKYARFKLIEAGVNPQNVYCIPNGIRYEKPIIQNEQKKFIVIFIGRLNRTQKGIDRLLNVMAKISKLRISDIKFHVIGSGRDEKWLEKRITPQMNCRLTGYISESAKMGILSCASLLISTSNLEPFSLAITEGLLHGIPVVSTPTSGPSFLIGQNKSFGSITEFNPESIAKTILLYFNSWKRDKMLYYDQKLKRAANARTCFSLEDMTNSYELIIHEAEAPNRES